MMNVVGDEVRVVADASAASAGGAVRAELPTGLVTFLMTDIEGSTDLWQHHSADVMRRAIVRHYELLDDIVDRHGGQRPVEQGEGDSIVAVFVDPAAAVAAALDIQLAVGREPWPGGIDLAVRIGIHTGEAHLRDAGNYVGNAIIRCARIRSSGHGGQILLSAATESLVTNQLPAGADIDDRGVHRLKGLVLAERIWELRHREVPLVDTPLVSSEVRRTNLPEPPGHLIGRAAELDEIGATVDQHRLVTLVGPGGVGKTRLALAAAAAQVDHRPGGVWWVELAAVSDIDAVAPMMLAAMSASEDGMRPAIDVVTSRLSDSGPVLLVLDNCEHLMTELAELVHDLGAACPDLTVLATSRSPLDLAGEMIWRVPALDLPDAPERMMPDSVDDHGASAMFVDRARRVRPQLIVDDDAAVAIANICIHLDGIPLAIEIAAAQCRRFTPQRIADRLDDRWATFAADAADVDPRQRTLEASIAWSHDLLADDERLVFRRLSVFAGPFLVEGAERVASEPGDIDEDDVIDLLGRLVDQSLVQFEDDGSYRLLETVKAFAADRASDADEADALRDAHADWWIEHLTELDARAPSRISIETCSQHRNDLRAALEHLDPDIDRRYRLLALVGPNWDFGGHSDDLARFANLWVASGPPDDDHELEWARCWPSAAAVWFRSWRRMSGRLGRRAVDLLIEAGDARGALGSYAPYAFFEKNPDDMARIRAAVRLGATTPSLFAVNAPLLVTRLHDVDAGARARWQPTYGVARPHHPLIEFAAPDVTNIWLPEQALARPPRPGDESLLLDRLLALLVAGLGAFVRGEERQVVRLCEAITPYQHLPTPSMWPTGLATLAAMLRGEQPADADLVAVSWLAFAGSTDHRYVTARALLAAGGRRHGDALWSTFDHPGSGRIALSLLGAVEALHRADERSAASELAASVEAERAHPWPDGHHDMLEIGAVLALRDGRRERAAELLDAARVCRRLADATFRYPDQRAWLHRLGVDAFETDLDAATSMTPAEALAMIRAEVT